MFELEPISVVEACTRVGHAFDMLCSDPDKFCAMLDADPALHEHPLRNLFHPPEDIEVNQTIVEHDPEFPRIKHDSKVRINDEVKARRSKAHRKETNGIDASPMSRGRTFIDGDREWYHATVRGYDEKTDAFDVRWVDGYSDSEVSPTDLMLATDGSAAQDVETQILEKLQAGRIDRKLHVRLLSVFALYCVLAPQIYVLVMHRHLKQNPAGENMDYIIWVLKRGGALVVGMMCMLVMFVLDRFALPWTYRWCLQRASLPELSPAEQSYALAWAKKARRNFTTQILDPLSLISLRNVTGRTKEYLILLYYGKISAFVVVAILTLDIGLIPFSIMMASKVIVIANIIFGRKSGLEEIRRMRMLSSLEKLVDRCRININKQQLRLDYMRFVEHPHNATIIQVSLPFACLLASVVRVKEADSIRLSNFVLTDAYAEYSHKRQKGARMRLRRSVLVDVFDGSYKVPGRNLEGERWHLEGGLLPWCMAVQEEFRECFEKELRTLGLRPGVGCFTWRSTEVGSWESKEAEDKEVALAHARKVHAKQQAASEALECITRSRDVEDAEAKEHVETLIRAGANANYVRADSKAKKTPLHRACSTGKVDTARRLIDLRADPEYKDSKNRTPLQLAGVEESLFVKHELAKSLEYSRVVERRALAMGVAGALREEELLLEAVRELVSQHVQELRHSQQFRGRKARDLEF